MTAALLWINVPFMVLAVAIWVGIPLWLVLRHPDRDPRETRTVPAYLQLDWHHLPVLSSRR
jgi:hypothetical protein